MPPKKKQQPYDDRDDDIYDDQQYDMELRYNSQLLFQAIGDRSPEYIKHWMLQQSAQTAIHGLSYPHPWVAIAASEYFPAKLHSFPTPTHSIKFGDECIKMGALQALFKLMLSTNHPTAFTASKAVAMLFFSSTHAKTNPYFMDPLPVKAISYQLKPFVGVEFDPSSRKFALLSPLRNLS